MPQLLAINPSAQFAKTTTFRHGQDTPTDIPQLVERYSDIDEGFYALVRFEGMLGVFLEFGISRAYRTPHLGRNGSLLPRA